MLRRHEIETAHLDAWLDKVRETVPVNYNLAVEIVKCRRLIKGYSDTHARGAEQVRQGALGRAAARARAATAPTGCAACARRPSSTRKARRSTGR